MDVLDRLYIGLCSALQCHVLHDTSLRVLWTRLGYGDGCLLFITVIHWGVVLVAGHVMWPDV